MALVAAEHGKSKMRGYFFPHLDDLFGDSGLLAEPTAPIWNISRHTYS
jgi:hypothetical protein